MTQKMRLIIALILIYFTYGMLLNTVGTVILRAIASLDVSKAQAGWFDGFKDISIAAVSFITASYLPRFGLKRAMQAGLILSAIACIMLRLVPGYIAICLHYMLIGISFAVVKVGLYAMIGLATDDSKAHASLTSIVEGGFMVGVLSVTLLFSLFVGNTLVDTSHDWLNTYWVLAAMCVVSLLMLSSVVVDEQAARPDAAQASIIDMLKLARLPLVLVFICCAFIYVFIEQGIGTWLPTFNNEVLGLPQSMSVVAGSFYAGAIAAGRILSGAAMRKLGWYPVVMCCLGIVIATILLIGPLSHRSAHSPISDWAHAPLAAYLFLGIGFFLAPIYPTIVSVLLSASPKSRHTELMGLVVIFSALGGTAGSRLTAVLFASVSGATAFASMVFPAAMLMVGLYLLRHRQLAADSINRSEVSSVRF